MRLEIVFKSDKSGIRRKCHRQRRPDASSGCPGRGVDQLPSPRDAAYGQPTAIGTERSRAARARDLRKVVDELTRQRIPKIHRTASVRTGDNPTAIRTHGKSSGITMGQKAAGGSRMLGIENEPAAGIDGHGRQPSVLTYLEAVPG